MVVTVVFSKKLIQTSTYMPASSLYRILSHYRHSTVFRHTCTFSTADTTELILLPNRGHILGGTSIIVTGPCFDESLEYTCQFGTGRFVSGARGVYLDERRLLCVSPTLTETGNVGSRLQIRGEGKTKVIPEDPVSFHSCT